MIEHTYGRLKNRFSSLKSLRVTITHDRQDELRAQAWIRCCVLLHNLLRDTSDTYQPDQQEIEPSEETDAGLEENIVTGSKRKHPTRMRLMRLMGLDPEEGL